MSQRGPLTPNPIGFCEANIVIGICRMAAWDAISTIEGNAYPSIGGLIATASRVIARTSQYAGNSLTPRPIQKVDLLPNSPARRIVGRKSTKPLTMRKMSTQLPRRLQITTPAVVPLVRARTPEAPSR